LVLRKWERFDDAKKFEILTTIERQGSRLAALTDDLLQMARIESGHLMTEVAAVAVRPVCDEVIADFENRSRAISVTGDGVAVLADRGHLCRVLINLIDNALKYGEVPIEVSVGEVDGRARIAVRDHGAGVPEEFVPRLFDRFAQASSGVTRQSSGTGLGMAIVKGLMDAMDGTITYEAAPSGGATFIVELPAA
jgi:signal transduction histidine kinase